MTNPVFLRMACLALLLSGLTVPARAQMRLADESDRAAFRSWFVLLADAQFERAAADVTDCAALVRFAFREALRAHTPEWARQVALPVRAAVSRRAVGAAARRAGLAAVPRRGHPAALRGVRRRTHADRAQHPAARPRLDQRCNLAICSTSTSPSSASPIT